MGSGGSGGAAGGTETVSVPRHAPGRRRRPELAAFLRGRRARVTPQEVGMPPGFRRRTPGLRREEAAQLAYVGVTWYTWLEQGRPINASPQVLDAVSRTLRLDGAEREHLYRLAEVAYDEQGGEASWPEAIGEEVQSIIDALHPRIATVYDGRYDVLATNAAYRAVFQDAGAASGTTRASGTGPGAHEGSGSWPRAGDADTGGLPGRRRANALRSMFLGQGGGLDLVYPERELSLMVATLRGAYGRHVGEPDWERFVHEMSARSPLFAELWRQGDVVPPGSRLKGFRHARAGEIFLRTLSLNVNDMPECRIVTYTAVDAESARRVDRLLAAAAIRAA
ncbi:helix-turn-helix transcriptional regulator [Streptomyces sp. 8L]|uniref:helix-turn-helix transcriptional regulator n=1 Tax=Streptomyces sp. 8L TaxID=2877242 RepID=UPI001CD1FBC7|nr:helix-turn-helix transcriptional regulator [Streptomyces sp. 8L]MCA1217660.1 helix-turn-helix transcriptional regulator [Streptomyces sp. 8L]